MTTHEVEPCVSQLKMAVTFQKFDHTPRFVDEVSAMRKLSSAEGPE
jgi:hypothetical protein